MMMTECSSEEHYDTPWEFLARPNSVRLSTADVRLSSAVGAERVSPHGSPSLCSSSSFVNQLVQIGNSAVDARRKQRDESKRRRPVSVLKPSQVDTRDFKHDEVHMEQNMNRTEAEKRLETRQLGDYLLRSRGEGSAALSLRATKGVVHIKIEWNGEKWVIGECSKKLTFILFLIFQVKAHSSDLSTLQSVSIAVTLSRSAEPITWCSSNSSNPSKPPVFLLDTSFQVIHPVQFFSSFFLLTLSLSLARLLSAFPPKNLLFFVHFVTLYVYFLRISDAIRS